MTSDGNLPADQRRNYKSVFDALFRIVREEGLFTLWRGAIPTMGRAMVVNAAQLASYSQAKQGILGTGESSSRLGYLDDSNSLLTMKSGIKSGSMQSFFLGGGWTRRKRVARC